MSSQHGIKVYNRNKILIIDSEYKNHHYHSHGTASCVQYINEVDITDITTNAIMFTKAPTGGYVRNYGFTRNYTNGNIEKILIASEVSQDVDWIVYEGGYTEAITPGSFGFFVYDLNENIVFSSLEQGYVNVKQGISYSNGNVDVNDALLNYFTLTGGDISYSYNLTNETTTKSINGIKYVDRRTINVNTFDYHVGFLDNQGSPGFSGGGSIGFAPKYLIEIKAPPNL